MILQIIKNLKEGYSEGFYQGSRYGITKETFNDGKSFKVFAKALNSKDFISLNFYVTSKNELLKPCEMPKEKVVHFLQQVQMEEIIE